MNFAIGRVRGTEIRAHWLWIPALSAITVLLGLDLTNGGSDWPILLAWVVSAVIAGLIFVSSIAHELAHVAVARRAGVVVPTILVHIVGGPFVMSVNVRKPGEELLQALSGPVVSLAIVAGCVAAGGTMALIWPGDVQAPLGAEVVVFTAFWVGLFNAFSGVANLIPGYPFDGGRIVHAVAWRITGSDERAVTLTGRFCRIAGFASVALGFLVVLLATFLYWAGLSLILVGGQLIGSAGFVERRGALQGLIAPLRAGDAVEPEPGRVPAQLTLDVFANAYLDEAGGNVVFVDRDGEVAGMVGAAQLKRVPERDWKAKHVEQVMTPIGNVPVVGPDTSLWNAIEILERTGLEALLVSAADGATTVLTRHSAARAVQARAQEVGKTELLGGRQRRGFRGR